jgi:hypothetical protein
MSLIARKISSERTADELMALLSAVGCAILAALFIAALYFGREIFLPNIDKEQLEELREAAKADVAAGSLREAMMICRATGGAQEGEEQPNLVTSALRIA